ncbi:MAG: hypothetical protein PHE27_09450 [Alphaproteobacteria bacterium]|nr:hypothetical protein [Alphaproteobacteria bacterium]
MFSPLSSVGTGLYQAVSRATQSATSVVKASSTGENIDENMVALVKANADLEANVAALKAQQKMQRALLDITV